MHDKNTPDRPSSPDGLRPISLQWGFALTFVAWFAEVLLTILLRPTLLRHGIQPIAAGGVIRVICYGGVFSWMLHASQMTYRQLLHPSRASVGATVGLLALPILMMVPMIVLLDAAVNWVLMQVLPMSAEESNWLEHGLTSGIGSWVLVCAIAPMVEEMFFRGILLRGMLKRYPPADAIVYSAFVFGFAHLNVYQFVIAFLMGLFAAALYRRTQSLWPGILLHAGLNTAVMIWANLGSQASGAAAAWPPVWVCAVFAAAGIVGAWMLRRILWSAPRGGEMPPDADPTPPAA